MCFISSLTHYPVRSSFKSLVHCETCRVWCGRGAGDVLVSLYLGTCPMTLYYRLCFMRRCLREIWNDWSRPRAEAAAREGMSSRRWSERSLTGLSARERCFMLMLTSATRHVYNPRGHEPSLRFTPDCFMSYSLWFKGTVQTYLAKYFCKTKLRPLLVQET